MSDTNQNSGETHGQTYHTGAQLSVLTHGLRDFLRQHGYNFGDITSDQSGRERFAPLLATYVVGKAAEIQVPARPGAADHAFTIEEVTKRIEQNNALRAVNRAQFNANLRPIYLGSAEEFAVKSRTIRLAQQLTGELHDYEAGDVAMDVVIALGALARVGGLEDEAATAFLHEQLASSA